MPNDLSPHVARQIIDLVGANGVPPQYGFQYFTAGLTDYLTIIEEDYLKTFIGSGGSAFKMVVGAYGGGKTHMLYCIRDIAWQNNFVVSYVSLSPGESPFHRFELVYGAIARGIIPPLPAEQLLQGYEQGTSNFLRSWYAQMYQRRREADMAEDKIHSDMLEEIDGLEGIESISFAKAIRAAFRALAFKRDGEFESICQWLQGEGYDRSTHGKHGILEKIDRSTAAKMLRSCVQWVKQINFSGLVILLDEAERKASMSSKQMEQHLSNLRELIDECSHTNFQSVMIFYAVPDETFLEGRTQVYEALKQRVSTVLQIVNPTGVKIQLDRATGEPVPFLKEVGHKLAAVYATAYDHGFDGALLEDLINATAEFAYSQRFADAGYKRLFVKTLIPGLHYLRVKGVVADVKELGQAS